MNNIQIAYKIAQIVIDEIKENCHFDLEYSERYVYDSFLDRRTQSFFNLKLNTAIDGPFASIIKEAWVSVMFMKNDDGYFVSINLEYRHYDMGTNGKRILSIQLNDNLEKTSVFFEKER